MSRDEYCDAAPFYDDLAEHFDLIFEDWTASIARQGAAIDALIVRELGDARSDDPGSRCVLDVACGIGTQSLALAERGYRVTARDISAHAVARLQQEAASRGLAVDAAVADMRSVASSVTAPFDAVIAFDNSLPHLLNDNAIVAALDQCHRVLRAGGLFACSVRDYDVIDRSPTSVHPYGAHQRGGADVQARQEWTWIDPDHYRVTFIVERDDAGDVREVCRTSATYYALSTDRLLSLMRQAGFTECRRLEAVIYQPVLVGRAT